MNNKLNNKIIEFDNYADSEKYTDGENYDDIRVSVSVKALYVLMITEVLRNSKAPLTVNMIIKHIGFMYGHIIISDDELDASTIQRYMDDLVKADYLSYVVYVIPGKTKSAARYGIRSNNNIAKLPEDFAKSYRMKPAVIYDFLYRNMNELFTASEISVGMDNKISAKTVRDTLIENECYIDSDNFEAMRIYSDEFRNDAGKWVTKFWCETNSKSAHKAS